MSTLGETTRCFSNYPRLSFSFELVQNLNRFIISRYYIQVGTFDQAFFDTLLNVLLNLYFWKINSMQISHTFAPALKNLWISKLSLWAQNILSNKCDQIYRQLRTNASAYTMHSAVRYRTSTFCCMLSLRKSKNQTFSKYTENKMFSSQCSDFFQEYDLLEFTYVSFMPRIY